MTEETQYETATPLMPDSDPLYSVVFSGDDDGIDTSATFVSPHPLTVESAANAMALAVGSLDYSGGSWMTIYVFAKDDSFAATTGGEGGVGDIFFVERGELLTSLTKSISDGDYEVRIAFKGEKRVKSEYRYRVSCSMSDLVKPDEAPEGWSGVDDDNAEIVWEDCEGRSLLLAFGYVEQG